MKKTGTKETKLGTVITFECNRCAGTGNWAPGRVCFKCQGKGYICEDTAQAAYNRKLAHVEEVKEIIAREESRLVTARFGKKQIQADIDIRKAQLVELEAELARMKRA